MPDAFKVTRVDSGYVRRFAGLTNAVDYLIDRVEELPPRYEITDDGQTWSPDRTLPEVRQRVMDRMTSATYGFHLAVRSAATHGARFRIRKVFESEGGEIVDRAMDQLGVNYIWADADPAGGGSAGFDCSGLVLWCYEAGAGIELPHSAEAQRTCGVFRRFSDRKDLRQGDVVWYHVGRLPTGQADHVGIVAKHGDDWWVVDASSSADAVVFRPIDSNPVMEFGYVPGVTHPR